MPRFKVDVTKTIGFTATVEADDAETAWDIVSTLDSHDFDINSRSATEEEAEDLEQGVSVMVTISAAEEDSFDVHYPALEAEE